MPNKNTFSIKPIKELIERYNTVEESVDPFANNNTLCKYLNDIDPQYNTPYQMDTLDFLKSFEDNSLDLLLFDLPYSPRQVSESYKKLGRTVDMETTQASFWSKLKIEVARVLKPEEIVISFA